MNWSDQRSSVIAMSILTIVQQTAFIWKLANIVSITVEGTAIIKGKETKEHFKEINVLPSLIQIFVNLKYILEIKLLRSHNLY